MKRLNNQQMAIVDVLMGEINILNSLIAGEQDDQVREELVQERMHLVVRVNGIYGTDHIATGSKISVINNDLYNV